LKLRKKK